MDLLGKFDKNQFLVLVVRYLEEKKLADYKLFTNFERATLELITFTEEVGLVLMELGVIPDEVPSLECCNRKAARKTTAPTHIQRFVCGSCKKVVKIHPIQYYNMLANQDLEHIKMWKRIKKVNDERNI